MSRDELARGADAGRDRNGAGAGARPAGLSVTAAALAAGVPEATRAAYTADWVRFATWCATTGRAALPASPETLTEYTAHLAYEAGRAPSTIERALAAIRFTHRAEGAPLPETIGARLVLRGYTSARARAKVRPLQAAPATPAVLRAMLVTVDRDSVIGARDAALLLLGFALAARRSELVALDLADVTDTEAGLDIAVYRAKTRRSQQVAVLYGTHPDTCPVRAVRTWIAMLARHGRTAGPLFVRIDRHGRLGHAAHGRGSPDGRLSGQAVAHIVARTATAAGLAPAPGDPAASESMPARRWAGHSLRRGLPTAARAAGHDLLKVGRHGGWTDGSKALLGYFADVDRWGEDNPLVGVGL